MTPRTIALPLATIIGLALLAGCGGSGGVEYYPGMDYPQYRYLSLYLRVQDPDGDPVRGARVYINDERVDGYTAGRWYEIGDEGPVEWQGWLHNWAVHDFAVRIDRSGQTRRLVIEVVKEGWGTRRSTVYVRDSDPDYMFVRIRFTMGLNVLDARPSEPEYFRETSK